MEIVKIPSRSRVMAFSNNCPLFSFSWERGFSIGSCSTGPPMPRSTLHHEQMISGEEMHPLIRLMAGWCNIIVWFMMIKLETIYVPLNGSIVMHVQ